MNTRTYIAEGIGTFALVFCGTGAIVINDVSGGAVTHPGIAITFGLIVMAMIYTFGDISGAHINPAVSVAFAYAKKFPWKKVPGYVLSQLLGALLASALLWLLFPDHPTLGATLPGLTIWRVFLLELILTYFLMLVIIHVSTGSKEIGTMAAVAIGGVVLLEAMFAGPVTGASMNPARSIAPALFSGNIADLWLYILAPIAGAILAVLSCRIVKTDDCCVEGC